MRISDFAVGVIALAAVTRLILPNRQTAKVISEMGEGYNRLILIACGESAIRKRERRALRLLGEMNDDQMTYLFAGLTDQDLDWIETQLRVGENL